MNLYQNFIKPACGDLAELILDTLFPVTCLSCGQEGALLCKSCATSLKKSDHCICIVCKKPSAFGATHAKCRTARGVDGLISVFDYRDKKISTALITGKYSFIPAVYELFGRLLAEHLLSEYRTLIESCTLVPVPLHPLRHRWRGFNQAEVLCRTIAARTGMPVENALKRKKFTKTQKDLKKEQRLTNLDGAFSLAETAPGEKQRISGKKFLLVDDVTTTGATLLEAAKPLKQNGAQLVWCLSIARD